MASEVNVHLERATTDIAVLVQIYELSDSNGPDQARLCALLVNHDSAAPGRRSNG